MIRSHQAGLMGEAYFIAFASSKGWDSYRSLEGHCQCDYVVDMDGALTRVEVKWIGSIQSTKNNYYYVTTTKFDKKNFDFMFVATEDGCYWIPRDAIPRDTLSIKRHGSYIRHITRPGKYEGFRVDPFVMGVAA